MIITVLLLCYGDFTKQTPSGPGSRLPFHHRHHQCLPSPHFSFPISFNRTLKLLTDESVSG